MIGVTGANGFIGKELVKRLLNDGFKVTSFMRNPTYNETAHNLIKKKFPDLNGISDFSETIHGIDTLFHCAARVHIFNENDKDALSDFLEVNLEGTINLAKTASKAGVKRFIFLSSVKACGESTELNLPMNEKLIPKPMDSYGYSKLLAEKELLNLAKETNMEIVIIRPVVIYGPGVKGNISKLIRLVKKQYFLPFGGVNNKRSLLSITNLLDLMIICIDHPNAANQIFFVSDGADKSLPEIILAISNVLKSKILIFTFPVIILKFFLFIIGKKKLINRLFGSLQVDIKRAKMELGWEPKNKFEDELIKCIYSDK